MKHQYLLPLFAGIVVMLAGCAPSTEEIMTHYNQEMLTGKFDVSMPYIQEALLDDEDNSDEDTPLLRLMSAGAKLHQGAFNDTLAELDAAEDVWLENDGKTANHASAMMINDQSYAFDPGLQDRMFAGLYKALIFGAQGKKNGARTELNRMMQYQENWLHKQRERIADAEKSRRESINADDDNTPDAAAGHNAEIKAETDNNINTLMRNRNFNRELRQATGIDVKRDGNIDRLTPEDYQNAYATHICGVFRWLNHDNAAAYLRDARKLNRRNPVVAKDLRDIRNNVLPQNEVWIYVEDGLCPVRDEVRLDLPLALIPGLNRYVLYAGIALPKLVMRDYAAKSYTVNGIPMTELENIDRLRKIEYAIYMRHAVIRELTRCLVRTVCPQVAAGVVANNSSEDAVRWSCLGFQVAWASYCAGVTQADLRSWGALPKRVLVLRMPRPENGIITLNADNQPLEIQLPAGNNIVWVRKAAVTAPFITMTVNFAD